MENINNFITKYKAELLIALGAISSIVASIATMDGVNAGICSIVIAVIAVIIAALKNGLTEATISLIANAIKIIIDEISKKQIKENDSKIMSISAENAEKELTIEDIKEMLVVNMKR